jgi:hypothetical protein
MFWPKGKCFVYISTSIPSLSIIFPNFLHSALYVIWTTPSHNCKHPSMCIHLIDPMGIHLLHYVHGNEHIGTHDVIHNTFAAITWNVGFHVGWKQLHALLSTTFNSFHQRVDIVLTKDGIRTLANVVIADLTQADLLPWFYTTQGFIAFDVAQAKERGYHNRHPIDQFFLLVIEVFGFLHKHVDMSLYDYANAIWSLKGTKGLHFSSLVTFLCQKVLITLRKCLPF